MLKVFTDSLCLEHQPPADYPERPARLSRVQEFVAGGPWGLVSDIHREDALDAVCGIHSSAYLERFERAVTRGDGLLDSADNPLSAQTWRASLAAVAVALEGADWVMQQAGRRAFAAVRPPGHHAGQETAMGFCYFNTVAVVAQYLLRHHGLQRLAILDFDVHHGNGTQDIFYHREDVFFVSLHQAPFYPGTGTTQEIGQGKGEGATLNVPLPAKTDDAGYDQAFRQSVFPALQQAAPEILLVSAGFDAWCRDPLGGMEVSEQGFADWGKQIAEFADQYCQGRVLSLLEGGYDITALPTLVGSYLHGLEAASES